MGTMARLLLLSMFLGNLLAGSSTTELQQDADVIRSLNNQWQNTPSGWGKSGDPCDTSWEGVQCKNSRVTSLILPTVGLNGMLSEDIGTLTQLETLDLSYNRGLYGPLPPSIGNLKQLTILMLINCSLSGSIPQELGNLTLLSFLALNGNKFTGSIPDSLGKLSNLYWLDLADNQLNGSLPISRSTSPGLDMLTITKHFHLSNNNLSGSIPENLFSSRMKLWHLLLDNNNFTGGIPASIWHVQSLQALRLDRNSLRGQIPAGINNLTNLTELNLANNHLTGPMPNLTGMDSLNYVDLSNNTFDPSEAPPWLSTIQSLTAIVIQSGGLYGAVPPNLFSLPQLRDVILDNNQFNGTFDMARYISKQLESVSFRNNSISLLNPNTTYNNTLILDENPVCNGLNSDASFCNHQLSTFYSSRLKCSDNSCPPEQSVSPLSCLCSYPYEGVLVFRAPSFRDVTDQVQFKRLEKSFGSLGNYTDGSVFIQHPYMDDSNYLRVPLKLFPPAGLYFNHSNVLEIAHYLGNQQLETPTIFGPYYFIASPYPFPGGRSPMPTVVVIGIIICSIVLVTGFVLVGFYAFRQKKKAQRAIQRTRPFASWEASGRDGDAPQLKETRFFSFDELKKATNNFAEINVLGIGGFGKVYRGKLPSGEIVAIKRLRKGSVQGGLEFKTEIELLSRVHHKNLVGLVGFCYEKGEDMLVYEFIPNRTLRDNLSWSTGIPLDWTTRLRIALGSARGLAYLHDHANPPIIHRDVKSTNILLDANLEAKVADFGLSKLVSDTEMGDTSGEVKGTLGYLDPEYFTTQQLTEKSDVYSFGVVMLELVTAKKPIENGKYIVREVGMALDRNDEEHYGLKEIMDPVIRNTTNLVGFRSFVELAMKCVEEFGANRPTMNNVVKRIEILLQNDGLDMNLDLAASSATSFNSTDGIAYHPYDNKLAGKDVSSSAFKYSGGYSFQIDIEPK